MRRGGGWWCEVLVAVLLLAAAPHATRAQDDAGVVRGCVLDEHGRALEGVAIALVDRDRWTVDDLAAQEVARTGADGRYVARLAAPWVDGLDRGALALVFSKAGLATVVQPLFFQDGPHLAVCMFPGVTALARVVDRDGRPLEGVRVCAWQPDPLVVARSRCPMVAARSDPQGLVRLVGAAPESLVLRIAEPGYARRQSLPAAWQGVVELTTWPVGFIEGQLVGADGRPLLEAGRDVSCVGPGGEVASATTDAEGRFRLPRMAGGEHVLMTLTSWDAPDGTGFVRVPPDRDVPVALPDHPAAEPAAQRLRGVVVRVVDDASGEVVEAAQIAWTAVDAGWVSNELIFSPPETDDWLRCDDHGRFVLADLGRRMHEPVGTLLVRAPGYAMDWSCAVPEDVETGDAREIEVRLTRAPAFECVLQEVGTGLPLAGQTIALVPYEGLADGGAAPVAERVHWRATSDQQGRIRIDSLAEGPWFVLPAVRTHRLVTPANVHIRGAEIDAPAILEMTPAATATPEVTGLERLPPGVLFDLHLPLGPTTQSVRDGLVSGMLSPAVVEPAVDGGPWFRGLLRGKYELDLLLPPMGRGGRLGRVTLGTVRAGDAADGSEPLDARIARPAMLQGRVELSGVDAVPGRLAVVAHLLWQGPQNRWLLSEFGSGPYCYLDAERGFRLRLAPGSWRLFLVDASTGVGQIMEPELALGPGQEHSSEWRVGLGAVRIHFGESPRLPGHHGSKVLFRPLWKAPEDGLLHPFQSSSAYAERTVPLAGMPDEWLVYLPCEPFDLTIERFPAAWLRAPGAEVHLEAPFRDVVRATPRAGQTLDIDLGLPRDGR